MKYIFESGDMVCLHKVDQIPESDLLGKRDVYDPELRQKLMEHQEGGVVFRVTCTVDDHTIVFVDRVFGRFGYSLHRMFFKPADPQFPPL